MRTVVLYVRVLKKFDPNFPEHKSYAESARRFLNSYLQFKPAIDHELRVVNCGTTQHDGLFDGVAAGYESYNGGGYDCGTYQAIAPQLKADLVLALNTHTYFHRPGWLEPFVGAARTFHSGVFGATSSCERYPHLRTPAIAFTPDVMQAYPIPINSRQEAADFEAGPANFSLWAYNQGHKVYLVTADGIYCRPDWRKPSNIFRRGDQTNCLIFDRHTDIYAAASPEQKAELERIANGG